MFKHLLMIWRFLCCSSSVILVILYANPSNAKNQLEEPEYRVKSAIIYKMIGFTRWANNADIPHYQLAYISNEKKLLQELHHAAQTIDIHGKKLIVVKSTLNALDVKQFQVVYLGANHNKRLTQLANQIRRTNTLLISNMAQNRRDVMLNFIHKDNQNLAFEVNRTNIVFERLSIDKQLMLLGGTEIDVAELFRESEYAVQQMKTTLFDNQKSLMVIKNSLTNKEHLLNETNQILRQSHQTLGLQRNQISQFKQQISDKEHKLEQTNSQLIELNTQVQHAQQSLVDNRQAIANQATRNKQQLGLIEQQHQQVAMLNQQIIHKQQFLSQQKQQIESQAGQLDKLHNTVVTQERGLWMFVVILVLIGGLMIYILRINAQRKISNQKLNLSRAKLVTLAGIGRDLTSTLALDQVLEQVYQNLNKVLDANVFLLGILQPEQNRLHIPLIVKKQQKVDSLSFSLDEENRPAVWCVKNKKELMISSRSELNKYFDQAVVPAKYAQDMHTVVYEPLIIDDKIVGCMSIQSADENAYSPEQLDMIRTLASYTAIAMANALGYTELERQKRQVELKNREIIATQEQLLQAEKMASLGTLTSGVAHEINNPTNFVHVSAQNLNEDLKNFESFINDIADDDEDDEIIALLRQKFIPLYAHLDTITDGTQRIQTIVRDLRAFTHHDKAQKSAVSIAACLHSTVNLIRPNYAKMSEFNEDYQDMSNLLCYPAQLNQVFMNLIVNAGDAIKEKQRHQDTKVYGHIDIHCSANDSHITITIRDNGCGMSEKTKHKLFEPFYTTKEVGEGTGLGLSIAYGIVQDHHGSIMVTSSHGIGSEFTLKLPLS